MKNESYLWDAWNSSEGVMVGDYRSHGRVTVEKDWYLNRTGAAYGKGKRGPYRYFISESGPGVETEVPNIRSISITRSIDSDVATCKISVYNQWHYDHGEEPDDGADTKQLGRPGYFTWSHGSSSEAQARWNQQTNVWADVLVPNALLRTYQGYGGHDKTLTDAIDDGNLTMTGVWLVNSVTVGSDGIITLDCSDMGKLLVDQVLYPPLVPQSLYPLRHCRYRFKEYDPEFDPTKPNIIENEGVVKQIPLTYKDSSGDRWYGPNASIHGHRPTDSLDGNNNTFALSVGNGHPSRVFCTDFFEYEPNGPINQIYIHPWLGNYTMYVCIKEGGVWLDDSGQGPIVYDHTPLLSSQPSALNPDTGADTPYVAKFAIPFEEGRWYTLPRVYNAERVRVTFRDHAQSPWGPFYYRVGIREIMAKVDTNTQIESRPVCLSMAAMPSSAGNGYWVLDDSGGVYAFGDARIKTETTSAEKNSRFIAIAATPTGNGYLTLEVDGTVHAFGDAPFYGSASIDDFDVSQNIGFEKGFNSISINGNNDGYIVGNKSGGIWAFGNCTDYGYTFGSTANEKCSDMKVDPTPGNDGYWIVDSDGKVHAFGDATHYGNLTKALTYDGGVSHIVPTSTGNGYWLLGLAGMVQAFGDATDYGQLPSPSLEFPFFLSEGYDLVTWSMAPSQDDDGYWILKASGDIAPFGGAEFYGSPTTEGFLRFDGTYLDYSDIVKEILNWSGFLLYDPTPTANDDPATYGNIEDTGIHAGEQCLEEDFFDKRAPLEVINELKEIVGYVFWIDDEGAPHFESPNWWASGNFYQDGTYTSFIPEIDERMQLTDYSVSYNDESVRSEIIIGSELPDDTNQSTVITKVVPETAYTLRGMTKPAIWTNGVFTNPNEQKIMAELIALHIWFQQRVGRVTCLANPAIQVNDQVRIFERVTSESYVHYIRGISYEHDLDSGLYTMTLETNWLGTQTEWAITRDDLLELEDTRARVGLSIQAIRFLFDTASPRAITPARGRDFDDRKQTISTIGYTGSAIEEGDPDTDGGGPGA